MTSVRLLAYYFNTATSLGISISTHLPASDLDVMKHYILLASDFGLCELLDFNF
jgi:hypothetical protein